MDTLGSITKDFPFLDDRTRIEIEAIMEAATDYWHFGEIIAMRAQAPDSPPMLTFLALYHVSRLKNEQAAERVYDAHPELPLPMPFVYPASDLSRGGPELVEGAIEHFQKPLATFYMLMKHYRSSDFGSPEETQAQERIKAFLSENPEFRLHGADFLGHTGYRVRVEGRPDEALELHYRALELARESDDRWHQVSLLTLTAEIEGQYKTDAGHFERAKRLLGEAKEIAESIGDRAGLANVWNTMSIYSSFRGEGSEFARCQMESARIYAELGSFTAETALNLSAAYGAMGDHATSLEWARQAVDLRDGPYEHMNLASLYMNLDDLESAEKWMESAKERVLRQGLEYALGRWHTCSGKLEELKGDFESAMESYEKGLEIHERGTRMLRVRDALHQMAKLEVKMFNPTKENRLDEHAGPYMKRYEDSVWEKDLPGHEANLLLLKAELRMKQGRHEESHELIVSVLELTDCPAMEGIHSKAAETREKWVREGIVPVRRGRTSTRR
jgi:tetratricopeptide (TPR) repeat protein